jgi:hypothetical protein
MDGPRLDDGDREPGAGQQKFSEKVHFSYSKKGSSQSSAIFAVFMSIITI